MKNIFKTLSSSLRPTLVLLAVLFAIGSACAATYTVNQSDDAGDGICDVTCTLRDAVTAANSSSTADTIIFDSGITTVTLGADIEIYNQGLLTISGPGANILTIDGGPGTNRIFTILAATVKISGVTLTGGNGTATDPNYSGAIGGAISSYFGGSVTLDGVVISGNSATTGGAVFFSRGQHYLLNSTITGNSASNYGAGIYIIDGSLTVINSTVTGNSATRNGGGFYIDHFSSTGELLLRNSTVSNNTAALGGGIYNDDVLDFGNSIIAANTAATGPEIYDFGSTISSGNNLVGDNPGDAHNNGSNSVHYQASDIFDLDPKLSALQNYGGPTPTQALLPNSPAIDAGNNALALGADRLPLATDQRGFARILDCDHDGTLVVDIGAFERVNAAPVASDDSYSTDEDVPLFFIPTSVLSNDNDVDSDPLSAVLVSGPTNALSFTLNPNGSFTYFPNPNFNGTDSFTYKASDGQADSNVATVTITVNAVNDLVVATNDSLSVNEDPTQPLTGNVLSNDTNVDNDPLSVILTANPLHAASFNLNADGTFSYMPNPNFNGTDTFTYLVYDGQVNSNVATVTITVNPVNDAPVAGNDSYSTNEDMSYSSPLTGVLANDTDMEHSLLFTATLVSGPAHASSFSFSPLGNFTYTPASNFNGTDIFTYKTNDGQLDSNIATVTITVNPVNDTPSILITPDQWPNLQYSDAVPSLTITASDLETTESALTLSFSYSKVLGPQNVAGLLSGLTVTDGGVVNGQHVWTVSGQAMVSAGDYTLYARVVDTGDGSSAPLTASNLISTSIAREDATVTPKAGNPTVMYASTPGGIAIGSPAPFCFDITETPDSNTGDTTVIDSASVLASPNLLPYVSLLQGVSFVGGGIGQPRTVCFALTLTNAPIGAYQVGLQIDGGYYTGSGMMNFNVVEPKADLLVGLGVNNLNPRQGDLITYTITVRNFGPSNALNTVVNDVLSSGSTFYRARANKGTFTAPPSGQTGTVTWYLGDIANAGQESAQIDVTVIVKGTTTITNSASVTSAIIDPNSANNSASITTSVAGKGGGGGGKKN